MPGLVGLGFPLGSTVASIRKDRVHFSGEKFFDRSQFVQIGTRPLKTMHKPRICINSNKRRLSKVPVVALLGLVHIAVSHTGGSLRRAWHLNDRGIHNHALGSSKPLAQEVLVDQGKDVLSE